MIELENYLRDLCSDLEWATLEYVNNTDKLENGKWEFDKEGNISICLYTNCLVGDK